MINLSKFEFTRYTMVNMWLFTGVIIAPVAHTQVFQFLSVGLLLPLLDYFDNGSIDRHKFFAKEKTGKTFWLFLINVLILETFIFYML